MVQIEGKEFFLPALVRSWSSTGQQSEHYKPYLEIRISEMIGATASIGFIPVYGSSEALRREHPLANELFFSKDTRLFPTICRRWVCEWRPASSIGYVPVYATLKALQADFTDSPYSKARLEVEEFRLPLPGKVKPKPQTISSEEFAELVFADAKITSAGAKITLPELVTLSPDKCQKLECAVISPANKNRHSGAG